MSASIGTRPTEMGPQELQEYNLKRQREEAKQLKPIPTSIVPPSGYYISPADQQRYKQQATEYNKKLIQYKQSLNKAWSQVLENKITLSQYLKDRNQYLAEIKAQAPQREAFYEYIKSVGPPEPTKEQKARQEAGLPARGLPGPAAGPRPGSPGETVQKGIQRAFQLGAKKPEKQFSQPSLEMPENISIMTAQAYGASFEKEPFKLEPSESGKLFVKSKQFTEKDTSSFLGIPYSSKSAYELGAVLVGGVERGATSITQFIPGKQPFEITEQTFDVSWRNIDDLTGKEHTQIEKLAVKTVGVASELATSGAVFYAAGYAGGVALGGLGAGVTRIPKIGPQILSAGSKLTSMLNTPIGKIAITTPAVLMLGVKTVKTAKSGAPAFDIASEILIDIGEIASLGIGVSKGVSFGKTLPTRIERSVFGGKTFKEVEIIPDAVTTGKSSFPGFEDEPGNITPSTKEYIKMAKKYTPKELQQEGMIPSYHATDAGIKGDFTVQPGLRVGSLEWVPEKEMFRGRGEYGMFVAPAVSKNFLRLGATSYKLSPGVPNIFSEPTIIQANFPNIVEGYASKESAVLANILKKLEGTGVLVRPSGGWSEAEAVLSPYTKMIKLSNRYYAELGSYVVKINQYIPEASVFAFKGGVGITGAPKTVYVSSFIQDVSMSYTPYIPTGVFLGYGSKTKPSKVSSTKIKQTTSTPSYEIPKSLSYAPNIQPSYVPKIKSPTQPMETKISTPSYTPPSYTPPSYTPPSYTPPSSPPYYKIRSEPKKKKKKISGKKRKTAYEKRKDPLRITFPNVKMPKFKVPKI